MLARSGSKIRLCLRLELPNKYQKPKSNTWKGGIAIKAAAAFILSQLYNDAAFESSNRQYKKGGNFMCGQSSLKLALACDYIDLLQLAAALDKKPMGADCDAGPHSTQ